MPFLDRQTSHVVKHASGNETIIPDVAGTIPVGVNPNINGLRLTLTTGTPVPTADVATATSIFLTPFTSGAIATYDSGAWALHLTAEISLALGTLSSGFNYDVFAYWTGSVVALELSAAWASDTARTDAIATQDGVVVKSADHSRRLVGTIRTISTTQTTDTATQRFVWNGPEPSRQVRRHLVKTDTTNGWTQPSSPFRQARASATNQVEFVQGVVGPVEAAVHNWFINTTAAATGQVGVGLDSTSANSAQLVLPGLAPTASTGQTHCRAEYAGVPSNPGWHRLVWLEGISTTTHTWGTTILNSAPGIRASVFA
jgi:hypothetical protein